MSEVAALVPRSAPYWRRADLPLGEGLPIAVQLLFAPIAGGKRLGRLVRCRRQAPGQVWFSLPAAKRLGRLVVAGGKRLGRLVVAGGKRLGRLMFVARRQTPGQAARCRRQAPGQAARCRRQAPGQSARCRRQTPGQAAHRAGVEASGCKSPRRKSIKLPRETICKPSRPISSHPAAEPGAASLGVGIDGGNLGKRADELAPGSKGFFCAEGVGEIGVQLCPAPGGQVEQMVGQVAFAHSGRALQGQYCARAAEGRPVAGLRPGPTRPGDRSRGSSRAARAARLFSSGPST